MHIDPSLNPFTDAPIAAWQWLECAAERGLPLTSLHFFRPIFNRRVSGFIVR